MKPSLREVLQRTPAQKGVLCKQVLCLRRGSCCSSLRRAPCWGENTSAAAEARALTAAAEEEAGDSAGKQVEWLEEGNRDRQVGNSFFP